MTTQHCWKCNSTWMTEKPRNTCPMCCADPRAPASVERERDDAWKAAHEVVKAELESTRTLLIKRTGELSAVNALLDRTRAELEEIRAERERAQLRSVGHERYGEGAIADGPGVPLPLTVRELLDVTDELVGNLAETFMRTQRRPPVTAVAVVARRAAKKAALDRQRPMCITCHRLVDVEGARCDVCIGESFPGHGAG